VVSTTEPVRLLILEDNPADAELAEIRLSDIPGFNFSLSSARSLKDAVRLLEDMSFDAAVIDLNLPDSVGMDTLRAVRATHQDLPIIVLSGVITEEVRLQTLREGAEDVIGKDDPHAALLARSILYAIERHRASEHQRQIEQVVEQSPDAMVVIDCEGRALYVNAAAESLFGKSRSELEGEHMGFSDSYLPEAEIVVLRGNETRTGQIRLVDIRWKQDRVKLATIRDVTERKILESRLVQAQKMEAVGQLAGGIAHDFNNLLNIINGYLDFYFADPDNCPELPTLLIEVRDAGRRAASLTSQLLAFGRRSVLSLEAVNLNELIRDLMRILPRLIGEHIKLEVIAGRDLAQVKLDPIQFDQVLLNLAVNARDAMPRGGRIIIETANIVVEGANTSHGLTMLPGNYIVLSFSDDGEGIDSATLHRIFEPFYTTKEMGRGTGLGLATVHGIVKQLGGYIFVYSEKGKGTTFKIYLPAVTSEGEPIVRVPSLEAPQGGTETILVAEDEDGILRLVDRVLTKLGYTVLTASSGTGALELAEGHQGRIDLLLTDVLMPNMIGPELAEQISAKRHEIKVLYMSGYTDETVVRFGVLNSTVNYIAKPFSPEKLARRVREVLGAGKSQNN